MARAESDYPEPHRRPASRVVFVLVVALAASLAGGLTSGLLVYGATRPKPAVTAKPSASPTPTAAGTLAAGARCPAVGSVAYNAASHATGPVTITKSVGNLQIYAGNVNLNQPPVVVVVQSGILSAPLVVCGPNARVVLYPRAVVSAAVVVQGASAQLVLADGAALPASYAATSGVTACVTHPSASTSGTDCSYYLPAPVPSPGKTR